MRRAVVPIRPPSLRGRRWTAGPPRPRAWSVTKTWPLREAWAVLETRPLIVARPLLRKPSGHGPSSRGGEAPLGGPVSAPLRDEGPLGLCPSTLHGRGPTTAAASAWQLCGIVSLHPPRNPVFKTRVGPLELSTPRGSRETGAVRSCHHGYLSSARPTASGRSSYVEALLLRPQDCLSAVGPTRSGCRLQALLLRGRCHSCVIGSGTKHRIKAIPLHRHRSVQEADILHGACDQPSLQRAAHPQLLGPVRHAD